MLVKNRNKLKMNFVIAFVLSVGCSGAKVRERI
jgi:hypothetical protein